jgi:hypothetical protein
MTKDQKIIRGKVGLLELAKQLGNVSQACKMMGYAVSQCCRKRIEEAFGWAKGSAGLAKVKLRGKAKVDAVFTLALAAYNLIRLPKLLAVPA